MRASVKQQNALFFRIKKPERDFKVKKVSWQITEGIIF